MIARDLPTLSIAPDKLTGYLLNVDHVEGGSKARWFLARGFDIEEPEVLAMYLARHAFENWPSEVVDAPSHGVKHKIVAPLACPNGTAPNVLAIWLFEPGETSARFVTARPFGRKG